MPNRREEVDLNYLVKVLKPQEGLGLFRDNDSAIWNTEAGDDGVEYITRNDTSDKVVESAESSNWVTASDSTKQAVTLFYKNTALHKFTSEEYGFNKKSVKNFGRFLIKKAIHDKKFVDTLVALQSSDYRDLLRKDHPELFENE